jgi:sugar phosphate isomerase/epimerase
LALPGIRGASGAPAAVNGADPKFKLGIVTYNVTNSWDVPTIAKVCKAAGIAAVEFRTTHKHGVEPTLSKAERQNVKKIMGDAGVQIWGCGSICEFQAPDPAVVQKNIETCKQFCELVADLGGKGVKVRPNGVPKGGNIPLEKTLEQIGKSLAICGKAAEGSGVEIFVEVHGAVTAVPANMKTIMEQCGHPKVGVCWNSNDGTDVKDGSVAEAFAMLKPWLRSCHINDLWKDGAGKYPYRELFRLLRESGYDRVTLCEVGTPMPDEKSGLAFLQHYKALWDSLARG